MLFNEVADIAWFNLVNSRTFKDLWNEIQGLSSTCPVFKYFQGPEFRRKKFKYFQGLSRMRGNPVVSRPASQKSTVIPQPQKCIWSRTDAGLSTLTLKTFSAILTHMVNICDKFFCHPSTKYRYIILGRMSVYGQCMGKQTANGWKAGLKTQINVTLLLPTVDVRG